MKIKVFIGLMSLELMEKLQLLLQKFMKFASQNPNTT